MFTTMMKSSCMALKDQGKLLGKTWIQTKEQQILVAQGWQLHSATCSTITPLLHLCPPYDQKESALLDLLVN